MRNRELEEQMVAAVLADRAAPDRAPFVVFADWLIAHGEPFGELLGAQLAGHKDRVDAAHFAGELRGPLDPKLDGVAYSRSMPPFWGALEIGGGRHASKRLAGALEHPLAAILDKLVLRIPSAAQHGSMVAMIERAPRTLRELIVYTPATIEVGAVLNAIPNLEHAIVHAPSLRGELSHAGLRRLFVRVPGLGDLPARLAEAALPRLANLHLGALGKGELATMPAFAPLLAAPPPKLACLELTEVADTGQVCRALASSRLLSQLTSLDIKGTWSASALDTIRELRPRLAHLERLALIPRQDEVADRVLSPLSIPPREPHDYD